MGRRRSSSSAAANPASLTNSTSPPSRSIPTMRRRRPDRHWGVYMTNTVKKYPCVSYTAAAAGIAAIYVSWAGGGQGPSESFTLEVRRSTIPNAGLGVFLAANSSTVAKGTVLTVFGERMVPAESTANSVLDLYALRSSQYPHLSRVGDPWVLDEGDDQVMTVEPSRPVGHMLNDAQAITLNDVEKVTVNRVKALVDAYEGTWEHTSNVKLLGDGTWRVVAASDIHPAQELFYSYGAAYWLKMILRGSRDPLVRLSLLLYTAIHEPQRLTGDALILTQSTCGVVAVLKATGEEPSEEWCEALFAASLSLSPTDIHAYDQQGKYGWGPGMACNDRLQCLARMVGRA